MAEEKTYFIDAFCKNDMEYVSPEEWRELTLDEVFEFVDGFEGEPHLVYYLSEQGGEEDIARWTKDDMRLINAAVIYLKVKEKVEEEY